MRERIGEGGYGWLDAFCVSLDYILSPIISIIQAGIGFDADGVEQLDTIEIRRHSVDTWEDKIADCMVDEDKRHCLKGLPIILLSAARYEPCYWYWLEWTRANDN